LNRLIATADENSTILLPSGTLDLYEPLHIGRGHITIRGDHTILLSHLRGTKRAVVEIEGSYGGYLGKTLQGMKGKIRLKTTLKKPPKQGDLLLIEQKNDKEYVQKVLGAEKWYRKYPKLRSEIVEVADFSRGVLTMPFYSKSPIDKKASIYKIEKISDVTLQNLTIDSIYKSAPYRYIYKNLRPDIDIDGIRITYASHIALENLQIYNSGSSPLVFERSYGCRGENITIDGALNKGKKGHGYLRINKSFHLYLKRISVANIRHVVFQWASAYNTIEHIDSRVDINFHGGGTHDNQVLQAKFDVDIRKHKWGKVFTTPTDASWAPPDFKSNIVEERR